MNRIIITTIAVCALTTLSCVKEAPVQDNVSPQKEDVGKGNCPQIIGIIDNCETKTTYDGEGKFSWLANDKIAVQIVNGGTYSSHLFKAASAAAETTFSVNSDAIPDGYSIGDYAFYPADLKYSDDYKTFLNLGYNNDNPVTVSLPAITEEWIIPYMGNNDYMQMVPLVGTKQSESEGVVTLKFVAATGILKLHFSGVPDEGGIRLQLSHPTYPLCGNFSLSEDKTILAENYISGSAIRELRPAPACTEAYVALPIGTIPAGLKIKLYRTNGDVYAQLTTSQDIEIERNTVTDLTMPIKRIQSTVTLCMTSTSDAPKATVTVADGEAVALATDPNVATALNALKDDNKASWRGGVDGGWITVSGDYPIASTNSKMNYLVWKIRASDGHIYYKSTSDDAIGYYEINTGMRDDWINGTYTVTSPSVMAGSVASTTFTLGMSDDITKGNLMFTEFDGVTGKAYGVYAGGMDFTFYAATNKDRPFTEIDSKKWYFRNGNEANNVVFTLVAKGSLPAGTTKACYLKSKWCGLKNNNGDNWTNVYYGYENDNNINSFYGVVPSE